MDDISIVNGIINQLITGGAPITIPHPTIEDALHLFHIFFRCTQFCPKLSAFSAFCDDPLIRGLKTGLYYLRTKAAADAIKFTVDVDALKRLA